MEIYIAISDFTSPTGEGSQNILSFNKGDKFEIFDCHKSSSDSEWWGARSLRDNSVGYVPSKYIKYENRQIGSILPDDNITTKEDSLKRFTEMQSHEDHRSPVYNPGDITPETPLPDYDDSMTESPSPRQFKFARQFSKVLSSIKSIDEMYPDIPEPAPDYNDNDSYDSVPPYEINQTDSYNYPDSPTNISNSSHITDVQKLSLSNSINEAVVFRERKASNPELEKRLSDPGTDDLLIRPKKLPNPCMESKQRMALHKELLHNYKVGKNILEKPELHKVLEKRKEKQRIDEWESQKKLSNKRTSLELKLEQQRQKEQHGDMKPIVETEEKNQSELSKVQAKILSKNSTTAVQ